MKRALHITARAIATAALLVGGTCLLMDLLRPDRAPHPVTPEGRILVIDSPTPVMLAQLRERIAR